MKNIVKKHQCECGYDDYGRFESGTCKFCVERKRQDEINSQLYFRRIARLKSLGEKYVNMVSPEMIKTVDYAIYQSRSNDKAQKIFLEIKEMLIEFKSIKDDPEYKSILNR